MKRFWKKNLTAATAVILLVSVYFIIGVFFFSAVNYNRINTRNLEYAVRTLEEVIPASVFSDRDEAAALISRLENFESMAPYRITLINRNGQVIYDSVTDFISMGNHLDRSEFQDAITKGFGTARRQSATLGHEYIYAAVSIENSDDRVAGILRLSLLVPSFISRFVISSIPFLLGGVLLIIAACIGLYRYSGFLSFSLETNLNTQLQIKTQELKEKADDAETEGRRREAILNSMYEGVIALDNNLKIILVNPRLCFLFGVDRDKNVKGMSLLEFSSSTELERAALQVLSSGQSFELILKRYVLGIEQQFQVFATPLGLSSEQRDPGQGNTGVVIVLSDISRLVKLEQIRKDFAANVSHELRTPIQVIKGFAENILASLDDREQIRHFAEIIAKNAQTMENLSSDLLTLVSLEDTDWSTEDSASALSGKGRPSMELTALSPLIAEAISMVEISAANKNILIETSCPPDFSAMLYGPFIVQALINLLDNAIKYSGVGSRIMVSVLKEKDQLVIEVKDEGIGIPAEHLGRIFERFYRVDKARQKAEGRGDAGSEAGGTGLGLAIVRHIALLHKGTAEAESHAGEGSVFTLRLPLKSNE